MTLWTGPLQCSDRLGRSRRERGLERAWREPATAARGIQPALSVRRRPVTDVRAWVIGLLQASTRAGHGQGRPGQSSQAMPLSTTALGLVLHRAIAATPREPTDRGCDLTAAVHSSEKNGRGNVHSPVHIRHADMSEFISDTTPCPARHVETAAVMDSWPAPRTASRPPPVSQLPPLPHIPSQRRLHYCATPSCPRFAPWLAQPVPACPNACCP